ncbi:hypothetical protein K491DRAFT_506178 [Lophiostoma macrostomum CBS 122681]|uniref:Uncharacterized protein n=1 Tax=Lophiostoma macrostomum CBS 122681 TaxID=1314788 RepID=A0A6A6TML5_9PLEO|nr:hypothetical protein K491DRAFT_506178 [Lophiostoma macrostomum CBS 122681]
MKRKRSNSVNAELLTQKAAPATPSTATTSPCHLLGILAQYAILESIMSRLFPNDLYALAGTSRAAYDTLFQRPESRTNLLKKMQCDGSGISIRKRCHRKSKYFYEFNCTELAACGTRNTEQDVESRSCVACGATTCDECRIHCVYQSVFQPPDESDELPNYSGFVLLDGIEMGILSPAHLGVEVDVEWTLPCHDQGYLDIPLESDHWAAPETIKNIIDLDLGTYAFRSSDSDIPHPSPVIGAFWNVSNDRQRKYCVGCFKGAKSRAKSQAVGTDSLCHCSFRSRFLDRWLCLRCYQRENHSIKTVPRSDGCICGQPLDSATCRTLCLWCYGEVKILSQEPQSP